MGNSNSTALTAPANSTGLNFQFLPNFFNLSSLHQAPPPVMGSELADFAPNGSNGYIQFDHTTTIVIPPRGTHTAKTFTKITPEVPQSSNLSKARKAETIGEPTSETVSMEEPEEKDVGEEENKGVPKPFTESDVPQANVFDYDELVEEFYSEHPNPTPIPVNTITSIKHICREQYGACRFIPTTTTIYKGK